MPTGQRRVAVRATGPHRDTDAATAARRKDRRQRWQSRHPHRAVRSCCKIPDRCRMSVQTSVDVRRAPWLRMSVIDLSAGPAGSAGPSRVFRAFAVDRPRLLTSGWRA